MAFSKGPYSGLDLVLHCRDCVVWDYGFEGGFKVERYTMKKSFLTDFAKGIIIGFCIGIIVVGITAGILNRHQKERELSNYVRENVEKQQAIEILREDYGNRDPVEFLDDIPGVRGAADGASAEFLRKRDEAIQRLRN